MSLVEIAQPPSIVRAPWIRRTLVGAAVLFAVFFIIGLLTRPSKSIALASAKEFSLPALSGNGTVKFRAGQPTVVNFFASWCIPCRRELPMFADASAKVGSKVNFVGVDHQDSRRMAQDLLATFDVKYPAGYDPNGTVAKKYGLSVGLPATVFIDANGKVVHQVYGEVSKTELDQWLNRVAEPQQ